MLKERASGILLPVASLPGKDIGNFGQVAYDFVENCVKAGQSIWQVLPIGQTISNDSPFYSPSAFAISPNYINLEDLVARKYITQQELEQYYAKFDHEHPNKINYGLLWEEKMPLLRTAYKKFCEKDTVKEKSFVKYCQENADWLDDYANFMAIKEYYKDNKEKETWFSWDNEFKKKEAFDADLAAYEKKETSDWKDEKKEQFKVLKEQAYFYKFLQWVSSDHWHKLKAFANKNGVYIMGDCPIYVAPDSADVWSNPKVFKLDENRNQSCYAGVPPDYFSPVYGQFWGNPIYKWSNDENETSLNQYTFDWWTKRLDKQLSLFDELRIDHFRGFAAYWEIPADKSEAIDENGQTVKTAKHGEWKTGPKEELFKYIAKKLGKDVENLGIIAEDLGVITDEVNNLRRFLKAPGMGIFQFAQWKSVLYRTHSGEIFPIVDNHWNELQYELDYTDGWKKLYYDAGKNQLKPLLAHEFLPESVVDTEKFVFYPGTHDNETIMGWFYNNERARFEQNLFLKYLEYHLKLRYGNDSMLGYYLSEFVHWKVIRVLCGAHNVKYAIFQMQDILGLPNVDPENHLKIRTNIPNEEQQWQWKLGGVCNFSEEVIAKLHAITKESNR